MKLTRIRRVSVAAVLTTIAIAAPVSTASAATAAPATVPVIGPPATVTAPTFVTTSPSTFTNYNSQTSAGSITAGAQSAT